MAAPENKSLDHEFKDGRMRILGNVITIGKDIYQISNISTVSVVNLSYDKPFNRYQRIYFYSGLFLIIAPLIPIEQNVFAAHRALSIFLGVLAISFFVYLFNRYLAICHIEKHALTVLMNAGNRLTVVSSSEDFLGRIGSALRLAINSKQTSDITINLDQSRQNIFDNISKSVINLGQVDGDISN